MGRLSQLSLENVASIDGGRLAVALNQAIARCESDCRDRPGLNKDRKISLTIKMRPIMNDKSGLDSCDIGFEIKDAIPRRDSKSYNMKAGQEGLWFNDDTPENPGQLTIGELEQGIDEEKPTLLMKGGS